MMVHNLITNAMCTSFNTVCQICNVFCVIGHVTITWLSCDLTTYSFCRPLLVILDQDIDLATPLHHTWTYQALVHDCFVSPTFPFHSPSHSTASSSHSLTSLLSTLITGLLPQSSHPSQIQPRWGQIISDEAWEGLWSVSRRQILANP